MNVIIVDDDPLMVKLLESYVAKTDFLSLVGTCKNAIEASNLLKKERVDLIFLDVEMPHMTGIEFLKSLQQRPQIVLITSNEGYAVEAFNLDVVDYIVKPAEYARFLKAANKAIENLGAIEKPKTDSDTLFIKAESGLVALKISEIVFVEARADYVTIHTATKRYTVYSTMKGIESKLPPQDFIRAHRSYIINMRKIDAIEDNTLVLGQKLIPLGVTYKDKVMSNLNLL